MKTGTSPFGQRPVPAVIPPPATTRGAIPKIVFVVHAVAGNASTAARKSVGYTGRTRPRLPPRPQTCSVATPVGGFAPLFVPAQATRIGSLSWKSAGRRFTFAGSASFVRTALHSGDEFVGTLAEGRPMSERNASVVPDESSRRQ